jgi:serine/threonine protein kinase
MTLSSSIFQDDNAKACAIRNLLQSHKIKSVDSLIQCSQNITSEFFLQPLSSGNQGETLLMMVDDKPFAVVKYAKYGIAEDEEVLHEIAVGLVLNTLRWCTPNFMFVYGGFLCTPPYDKDRVEMIQSLEDDITKCLNQKCRSLVKTINDKELAAHVSAFRLQPSMQTFDALYQRTVVLSDFVDSTNANQLLNVLQHEIQPLVQNMMDLQSGGGLNMDLFCSNPNDANVMLISEYINGITMKQFVDMHSGDDELIACLILQVLLACTIAYKTFGFKHNDLHLTNVLVADNTSTDVRYVFLGNPIVLSCVYVAKMIDYGFSQLTKTVMLPTKHRLRSQFAGLKRVADKLKNKDPSTNRYSCVAIAKECLKNEDDDYEHYEKIFQGMQREQLQKTDFFDTF